MKKTKLHQIKLGFSLIELSVVILVIGILVIGITQGSRILSESKIKSGRSLTQSSPVASTEGLALWLETTNEKSLQNSQNSYNIADGNNIKNWTDISPTISSHLVATESTDMPIYKRNGIGGLPTLFFDAASDASSGDDLVINYTQDLNTSNFTLFIVTQPLQQTTSWGTVVMSRNSPGGGQYGYNLYKNNANTNWQFWLGSTSAWNIVSSATLAFNKPMIFDLYRNNTESRLYRNSILENTVVSNFTTNPNQPFAIGKMSDSNTLYYDGYISEIIYFKRALKNSERTAIENYLSQKYSIKLL